MLLQNVYKCLPFDKAYHSQVTWHNTWPHSTRRQSHTHNGIKKTRDMKYQYKTNCESRRLAVTFGLPEDISWTEVGHGHNQAPSIRTKQHGGTRKEAFKRQKLAITSKWLFLSLLPVQTPPEIFKAWTEWLMPYRTTSLEMLLFKYEHYSNINDITNNKW